MDIVICLQILVVLLLTLNNENISMYRLYIDDGGVKELKDKYKRTMFMRKIITLKVSNGL